ncbi:uncharacterized protein LOC126728471 [Quercus robur]|uniref:uncharacterized protein LOC126728471 n=1 Tax=Quercus robur TaxID=38942 RepID=UPI0021630E63|nr:uncharacterized protein LOC126728471 [Quercus robur]
MKGRYRSNSPPPFTLEDLGVTTTFPSPVECPRCQWKKKTGHVLACSPSPLRVELDIQTTIPLGSHLQIQRSGVTLAQLLATPIAPRTYTPPATAPTAKVLETTQATPTAVVAENLARETRARRKRPRGAGQTSTTLNPENSLHDLRDARVNVTGAPTYTYSFSVDRVPLPVIDRVRPWREGHGGKVTESVGKAFLLPEDMKHLAKWDDDSLLLNMKREAIMGYQCSVVIEERY